MNLHFVVHDKYAVLLLYIAENRLQYWLQYIFCLPLNQRTYYFERDDKCETVYFYLKSKILYQITLRLYYFCIFYFDITICI